MCCEMSHRHEPFVPANGASPDRRKIAGFPKNGRVLEFKSPAIVVPQINSARRLLSSRVRFWQPRWWIRAIEVDRDSRPTLYGDKSMRAVVVILVILLILGLVG